MKNFIIAICLVTIAYLAIGTNSLKKHLVAANKRIAELEVPQTPPPMPSPTETPKHWFKERLAGQGPKGPLDMPAYNRQQGVSSAPVIYPKGRGTYYDSRGRYWVDAYGVRHYY